MPESEEQLLREIDRLEEWCIDMWEMILSDGTVPATSINDYTRQVEAGQIRLEELKTQARENGWIA